MRTCLETPRVLFALLKHKYKRKDLREVQHLKHSRRMPLAKQGQQTHILTIQTIKTIDIVSNLSEKVGR